MKAFIQLLRPKEWAKNLFVFLPLFFSGKFIYIDNLTITLGVFITFCFAASSIYIFNDIRDVKKDRLHPVKKNRVIAAGKITITKAIVISFLLGVSAFFFSSLLSWKIFYLILGYICQNIFYSIGLKNIPILDVSIISTGFLLRVLAGALICQIEISPWFLIMTFILTMFMGFGKRYDELLLLEREQILSRSSISGYNREFLTVTISVLCSIIIVSYLLYTLSPAIMTKLGSEYLYVSTILLLIGVLRYLQIVFVNGESGSPTRILFEDKFLQLTLLSWLMFFAYILYL